eukprot:scaffold1267_cov171-Amphora_coffeaeformis.AAC.20
MERSGKEHNGSMSATMPKGILGYGSHAKEYQRVYAQSVEIEIVEQGKTILGSSHPQPLLSGLGNDLKVPTEVSQRVQGFASSKPPPISFFEEHDQFVADV